MKLIYSYLLDDCRKSNPESFPKEIGGGRREDNENTVESGLGGETLVKKGGSRQFS